MRELSSCNTICATAFKNLSIFSHYRKRDILSACCLKVCVFTEDIKTSMGVNGWDIFSFKVMSMEALLTAVAYMLAGEFLELKSTCLTVAKVEKH